MNARLTWADDYAIREARLDSLDAARELADGDESAYTDPRSIIINASEVFDVFKVE